MKDMLLGGFLIFIILTILLWMADRRKWEQKSRKQDERGREYLQQKEKLNTYISKLERELAQTREENKEVREKAHRLENQKNETDRILSDGQKTVRKASVKIHLYIQLLKEQCGTGTAQKQCDIILRECENLLDIPGESVQDYGDNITEK